MPYRTEDRKVGGAVVTFADITELKTIAQNLELARQELEMHVEERTAELRAEKHRLQSVLETAIDAILTIDQRGIIDLVNPAAEQMFGYTPGELAGQPIELLMPDPYAEEHDGYIRRYLESRTPRLIGRGREVAGRRKDGSVFPIELTVGEDRDGKFTGIIRDLTRRKRLEDELHQSQKLETIGRLTGGIAHDFNNVLMGIMSSSDVLLRKLAPAHEGRSLLEAIKREAVRGSTLTRQLLSFSRKREVHVEALELASVVAALQSMLEPILGKDVQLHLRFEADGALVLADRGQVEQIVVNLVTNARDAIAETGTIELSVTREHLDAEQGQAHGVLPGPYVALVVRDDGCGMDEATRARAMEPFFTTKAEGEGTGLGLSTVFGMVEQARGQVSIESAPGEGTVIRVLLPEFDESKEPHGGRGDATVLLVEDEEMIRFGVERYLQRNGYTVLTAADAEAALELAEGAEFDLLLTDIVLPVMSGSELAERLRDRGRPTLFMSAFPSDKLLREERVPRGAHTLHKPFTEPELLRAIRLVMDSTLEPEPRPPSARVLIVEDSDITRTAYTELLREYDFEIHAAESGAQARQLAHSTRFDLLLCDLGLSDEPGSKVAADLRKLFPELAVLFVTGVTPNDPSLIASLDNPRTKLLTKPIELDDLLRAITSILRR